MNTKFIKQEQERVNLKIAKGYGCGKFENYTPWISYYNGPGRGHKGSIPGYTTNRHHSFLSDLEEDYFYITDFNPSIVDIREQFPLVDLFSAVRIAEENGIRYPKDKNGHLAVLTTDFVLFREISPGNIEIMLRDVKTEDDLKKPRTLEKLEIARLYWEEKGYKDYKLVTEDEIDRTYARNVGDILFDIYLLERMWPAGTTDNLKDYLLDKYCQDVIRTNESLGKFSLGFDKEHKLSPGTGMRILSRLIKDGRLKADLKKPLKFNTRTQEVLYDLSG